jgi:hypothetical protein
MITAILFDSKGSPVGRATLPDGSSVPSVVLWNDRAYLYADQSIAGVRYNQVSVIEIPLNELRKAPGIG